MAVYARRDERGREEETVAAGAGYSLWQGMQLELVRFVGTVEGEMGDGDGR
jgi:hypothetical protein